MNWLRQIISFLVVSLTAYQTTAQVRPSEPMPGDTFKLVKVLHADYGQFLDRDSVKFQVLVGKVHVQQGKTFFDADSIIINQNTNVLEAFGHVHITDNDTTNIYSDYLKYFGNERIANFRKNVLLTDGKGRLNTNELDYDLGAKIGTYRNGGTIEKDETILSSKEGIYYSDTKDVYFKQQVRMNDPNYKLASDTLLYNLNSEIATFVSPTVIDDGESKIYTRDGFYNLKTGKANFGKRPTIVGKEQTVIGDSVAFDKKSGDFEAKGNVVYRDTVQNTTLFAGHLIGNRDKKVFLAYQKPVLIIKQEADSIYIAADTLFSGLVKDLGKYRSYAEMKLDTLGNKLSLAKDSAVSISVKPKTDTLVQMKKKNSDSLLTKNKPEQKMKDSLAIDSISLSKKDSSSATDTLRFVTGFHHVRIFSDSMQAVCDSVFYSQTDSIFRMFGEPIVWNNENQITGDTIYLSTENQKPKELFVFENAIAISKIKLDLYNQIKGRTLNAFFSSGQIDSSRTKGNAESIYYAQDEDSSFVGMNRATADIIDMYFKDKQLNKVVFRNDVRGRMVPMRQIDPAEKKLPGFKWLIHRRPKNKYELFL